MLLIIKYTITKAYILENSLFLQEAVLCSLQRNLSICNSFDNINSHLFLLLALSSSVLPKGHFFAKAFKTNTFITYISIGSILDSVLIYLLHKGYLKT